MATDMEKWKSWSKAWRVEFAGKAEKQENRKCKFALEV